MTKEVVCLAELCVHRYPGRVEFSTATKENNLKRMERRLFSINCKTGVSCQGPKFKKCEGLTIDTLVLVRNTVSTTRIS